jgi:hypothetical protein
MSTDSRSKTVGGFNLDALQMDEALSLLTQLGYAPDVLAKPGVQLFDPKLWFRIDSPTDIRLDGEVTSRDLAAMLGLLAITEGKTHRLPADWAAVLADLAALSDPA